MLQRLGEEGICDADNDAGWSLSTSRVFAELGIVDREEWTVILD